jgi:hypothetical protein
MIKSIYNSIYVRPMVMLLIVSLLSMSFQMRGDVAVTLPAGTSIPLETVSMIHSQFAMPGQIIDFRVRHDIRVDDKVVIPAGSIAKGQIMRAAPAKGLGKEGFVEVHIKSVTAVDGSEIYLTGGNLFQEGEDRQTLAILLGVLVCILFLTMKGKNAEIPAGYEVNALTATNNQINLN